MLYISMLYWGALVYVMVTLFPVCSIADLSNGKVIFIHLHYHFEIHRARSRIKCGVRPWFKLVVHCTRTILCFNKGCCEYNLG
jgi:hypothetical protein